VFIDDEDDFKLQHNKKYLYSCCKRNIINAQRVLGLIRRIAGPKFESSVKR